MGGSAQRLMRRDKPVCNQRQNRVNLACGSQLVTEALTQPAMANPCHAYAPGLENAPNMDVVARTQVVLVIGCSTSDLDT